MEEKLQSLIQAIASRIPSSAAYDRKFVEAAFRAAVDEVPKSKLRDRLLKDQTFLIRELVGIVRTKKPEKVEVEGEEDGQKDEIQETDETLDKEAEVQPDGGLSATVEAAYKGVDTSNVTALLCRCEELLLVALASLHPEERANEALLGLLAFFPPEAALTSIELDMNNLNTIVKLLPLAATALAVFDRSARESVSWRRFLGLCLAATLRLPQDISNSDELEVDEATARIGSLVALIASGKAARSALRLSLNVLLPQSPSPTLLRRMATASQILRTAFQDEGATCKLGKGDLQALLRTIQFFGLVRRHQVADISKVGGQQSWLTDNRLLLRSALERDYDVTPMVPEMRRLIQEHAQSLKRPKALTRQLLDPVSSTAASSVLFEFLEATAECLKVSDFTRLLACSGLEADADEDVDAQADAARARGDLFFEDVGGFGAQTSQKEEIANTIKQGVLDNIEGIEQMKGPKKRKASVEPVEVTTMQESPKKDKTDHEAPTSEPQAGPVKRLRIRRKSSASPP